jgi:sugar phosphate isomerase/epimerase
LAGEIVAATQAAGLEHAGIAGYASIADHAKVESLLAATAKLGAGRARVAVPKVPPGSSYNAIFAQSRADIAAVSSIARRHGVLALIQIHHGNVVSTCSAALRMLEGIDPTTVGVIHDLGNMTIEGREGLNTYAPGMEMLGPYLAHVHVKNAVWKPGPAQADGTVDWKWSWAPLATGLGDLKSYMRSLREVGYDGWVTVENFTTDVPVEARIAGDLAYLRAAALDAGYTLSGTD